jgi:UDP-N-acetylglucosamine/UDP-N-acetyl-alpha-D-glucosaminouronate 4-epimerase
MQWSPSTRAQRNLSVLVTGGAGFIGTNLARALLRRNARVSILDNLSTGNHQNFRDLRTRVTLFRGDIRDAAACRRAVQGAHVVLHHAALRAVGRSVADPVETDDVNVRGTLNMLVAARDAGVRRFVFASSSSVYGTVTRGKNVESLRPAPESPYGVSKLTGEHYCRVFRHLYGLETVSLRYFNVFGPYQDPRSAYAAVIPLFVDHLLRGRRPTIHGDGSQSRDFTYVDNVVHANLLAIFRKRIRPGETYNIAGGKTVSINALLSSLEMLTGKTARPKYAPRRAGDIRRSSANILKAKHDLGYRPVVSFEEGLRAAVDWYMRAAASQVPSRERP